MKPESAQTFAKPGQWTIVVVPKDGADVVSLPSTCEVAAVARVTARRIEREGRWLMVFDQFARLQRWADGDQKPRMLWKMAADPIPRVGTCHFAGPRPKKG